MKINKTLNNIPILSLSVLAVYLLSLSSCLKDKAPGNENYSNSPALVGFQYKNFGSVPLIVGIPGTAQDTFGLEVALSVSSLTIKTPVTLTITPYQAGLDSFNTAGSTSYTQLDPSIYTLQNGGQVTINPGQQIVSVRINFAGDKIDFSKSNAIAFHITNLQGATLATNLSTAIVVVTQKNPYDGEYDLRLKLVGWGAYGISDGVTNEYGNVAFITTGTASNVWDVPAQPISKGSVFGATAPQFTFDPVTNALVSVVNLVPDDGRGRKFAINPAVTTSRWDPATKNIYMAYLMFQNGRPTQYIYDTLIYIGPRP